MLNTKLYLFGCRPVARRAVQHVRKIASLYSKMLYSWLYEDFLPDKSCAQEQGVQRFVSVDS